MRSKKLTSAHALALLALFVALAGSAGAATVALITGADVVDHSLTGRDIANHSLDSNVLHHGAVRSREVRNRSLHARDFDNSDLPGLTKNTAFGADIANYNDLDPLVTYRTKRGGDFLVITRYRVANTGASNDFLNCAFRAKGHLYPTAGAQTNAGQSTTAFSVTVVEVPTASRIDFVCQGGGTTTYDISKIRLRVLTLW